MDILVMLEENPDHSPVLAHVNSVPSPLHSSERPSRDIVTLYGEPSPESLALALAAAVESHRRTTDEPRQFDISVCGRSGERLGTLPGGMQQGSWSRAISRSRSRRCTRRRSSCCWSAGS